MEETIKYNEDNIRSLDWKEHIRLRPGMYIGKFNYYINTINLEINLIILLK